MHATASQKLVPRTATTQTRRSAFPPRATGPRSTVEISPLHSQCQGHSVIVDVESVRNHLSANATYQELVSLRCGRRRVDGHCYWDGEAGRSERRIWLMSVWKGLLFAAGSEPIYSSILWSCESKASTTTILSCAGSPS